MGRCEGFALGKPLMKQGIDLFCGIGGSSAGAELAGFEITWACNHDPVAISVHELNHPHTIHACEDALLTNYFDDVPDCDFMLASPACQGHSTASQPKRRRYHEESRASAWAVIQAIDAKRPSTVIIENTPGFVRWDGYNAWTNAIESFGYNIQTHLLNAADFGVPQLRRRLFVIATRGRTVQLDFPKQEWTPFEAVLEDTEEGWTKTEDACAGDLIRIAAGRKKCGERFLLQQTTGHKGVPLSEPIRTITTMDHWKLVDGDRIRKLTVKELMRGMGFPASFKLPETMTRTKAIKGIGNAVCPPMMQAILAQVG